MSDEPTEAAELALRRFIDRYGGADALAAAAAVFAELDRRGGAIERIRALCADYMAEAVGGGYTNVDTLWPTDVLAALDGEETRGPAPTADDVSEPCESCGTPITRRDPQPPDGDKYADLPKRAGVWDEDWVSPRPGVETRAWHSPKRCAEARAAREDARDG